MNTTNKYLKLVCGFIFSLTVLVSIGTANAASRLYHGAQCSGINNTQSAYFIKSKNGLINSYPKELFIVCPVIVDIENSDTNSLFEIEIYMTLPQAYASQVTIDLLDLANTGPKCSFRIMSSLISAPNVFGNTMGSFGIVNGIAITLSDIHPTHAGTGNGFFVTGKATTFPTPRGIDRTSSTQLLCLVPAGGTLNQYSVTKL